MRILDLFCGAGGAAMGYHQALVAADIGHTITGVDINPQHDYPFDFIQANATEFDTDGFDFVHASPPCQSYSSMSNRHGSSEPELIGSIRDRLEDSPAYVIENVEGASSSMNTTLMLCGTMFSLGVRRHRLFEASFLMFQPTCGIHTRRLVPVYGKPDGRHLSTRSDGSRMHAWSSVEQGQEAMGVGWIKDWHQVRESIPPAYTRFIMEQWLGGH